MQKSLTLATFLIRPGDALAYYSCRFGPDADGNYIEEIVDSGVALNCDSFCTCTGFNNSTCFFGPDDYGNFIKEEGVSSELADSCDRNFCTCDTQEFPEGETY